MFTVFTVFRLLTDFVCLYNYEFGLSLCKIVRSSVILLLPLFNVSIFRWSLCHFYEIIRLLLCFFSGLYFPPKHSGKNIRRASGFFIRKKPRVLVLALPSNMMQFDLETKLLRYSRRDFLEKIDVPTEIRTWAIR